MNKTEIIKENQRRRKLYFRDYSRIYGCPIGETVSRREIHIEGVKYFLPESMFELPFVQKLQKGLSFREIIESKEGSTFSPKKEEHLKSGFIKERFKHDFEYWASLTIKIQDKLTKQPIWFKLNRGQRRLVASYEKQRLAGVPIRNLLVKARQWGGSTVTQIYMLWLQLYHYEFWHSVIIAHLKSPSVNIRSMMHKALKSYPKKYGTYTYSAVSGSQTIKQIEERGCEIQVGTAQQPDGIRSSDVSMAHLSEVSYWPDTASKSGDDLAQSLYAAIPDVPGTFICLESTAKGIGNFFHEKYLAAKSGESELQLIFVSWFEMEMYSFRIASYAKFMESMTEYNWWQWKQGATLEGISWYNDFKKRKGYSDFQMKSEFPTTVEEAFQTKSGKYFEEIYIDKAKDGVRNPIFIGDIRGASLVGEASLQKIHLVENNTGASELLKIWEYPETLPDEYITDRYLIVVDIGGRSYKSDNSVIGVYDRAALLSPFGALEKVAEWVGHIDPDRLAWKAAQIATIYDDALLVIESNTLETKHRKEEDSITFEGDHFYTVMNELKDGGYNNLYARDNPPDKIDNSNLPIKYGWHMNKRTKYLAYDRYTQAYRDDEYIERSQAAVNEMEFLQITPEGKIEAIKGERDDIQDVNAIANYIGHEVMPMPALIKIDPQPKKSKKKQQGTGGISTF